ncbi:MAG TPA: hypothetical protein VHV83_08365 [Armatimonadota bacterium]|nr:hypothetical protein [Armatimonadota bacterium]
MRTIITVALFLVSIPLLATPSTLVTIPSTDIQPKGVWHFGADSMGNSNGSFTDVGLTYGISSRVEAGVDLVTGQDNPLWFNGKVQLLPPDKSPVALAVGIYNTGTASLTNQSIAYIVGSSTISGTRLTYGGYKGQSDALGDDDNGIMLGIDRTMGKWWLGADYASGKNAIGSWNVGVGYSFTDKISVILGYDNFNTEGVPDAFNVQLDANL